MTIDTIFVLLQIPLAAISAALYGRQYKQHGPVRYSRERRGEWLRSMIWLMIAAVSCGMVAWRLGTVTEVVSEGYRAAGGMAVQTLYQIVVLIAYVALKDHSGSKQ